MMAELPTESLDKSTSFANFELDYFGPFVVKIGHRDGKRWCCLFTCLTVRAVIMEIITNLHTDTCLNTIMRIIAQRCESGKMISDNGKNFIGADREFKEFVVAWNPERIEEYLVENNGSDRNSIHLQHLFLEEYGSDWSEVARKQCMQFGKPINHLRCLLYHKLFFWANIDCKTFNTS